MVAGISGKSDECMSKTEKKIKLDKSEMWIMLRLVDSILLWPAGALLTASAEQISQ